MSEEIGLWDTIGPVKIHRKGCKMLSTANPNKGFVLIKPEEFSEMQERGWKLVRCKCLSTPPQ